MRGSPNNTVFGKSGQNGFQPSMVPVLTGWGSIISGLIEIVRLRFALGVTPTFVLAVHPRRTALRYLCGYCYNLRANRS